MKSIIDIKREYAENNGYDDFEQLLYENEIENINLHIDNLMTEVLKELYEFTSRKLSGQEL